MSQIEVGARYRKSRAYRDQYVRVDQISGGVVRYVNLNSGDYGFAGAEKFLARFHHAPIEPA